jgi:hypothetical protein
MNEVEDWFKVKKYPHIGKPIKIKHYNRVKTYVENTDKIRTHRFLPFIHKTILKRKFRADISNPKKTPSGKRFRFKDKPKDRPILYASHLDAMIFSKYNSLLIEAYEKYIETKPFNESVVAYRKIPVEKGKKGNKCNIDFAKSAFEYINSNRERKLTVIVADITKFFQNIDHQILKRKWAEVLNEPTLSPDHYNIFKAITRIKYVESQQLFEACDKTVYVERGIPNSSTKKECVKKRIDDIKYFKEKNVVSFCDKDEFLENHLNLIISQNNKKGIPQGSPISATLANIYMLDFDNIICNIIKKANGFYQRYSDDLIIVCDRDREENVLSTLIETIKGDKVRLSIEPEKTKLYHFEIIEGFFKCSAIDIDSKELNSKKPLEYLGFSYDGQRVLIKTSGFSKFYRSMKGAFHRATAYALHSKNPDKSLFKSRLYKRFTHKGYERRLIYRPLKDDPKTYKKTKKYDWGNYLSYVYKADKSMISINSNNEIKRQSRKSWSEFHKLMKYHEKKLIKK